MISWQKLGKTWAKLLLYASLIRYLLKKWEKIIKKQLQNKYYFVLEGILKHIVFFRTILRWHYFEKFVVACVDIFLTDFIRFTQV